ncbi:hypothetical protein CRG98_022457 [Punica granatum]|uniref:Uncharacterized protein n=1 Tax=Punica granatum TaxID=22663 RepID=A0A2I0JLP8_PUNGR|nr:hypothetical protein CRG98_022457 [Punica granatum]
MGHGKYLEELAQLRPDPRKLHEPMKDVHSALQIDAHARWTSLATVGKPAISKQRPSGPDFLSTFPCGTISNTYTRHSPYRREIIPTILPLLDYVESFKPGFHFRTRIPIVRPFTSHEFHTRVLTSNFGDQIEIEFKLGTVSKLMATSGTLSEGRLSSPISLYPRKQSSPALCTCDGGRLCKSELHALIVADLVSVLLSTSAAAATTGAFQKLVPLRATTRRGWPPPSS